MRQRPRHRVEVGLRTKRELAAPPATPEVAYRNDAFICTKSGTEVRLEACSDTPNGAKVARFFCQRCGGYHTLTILKPQE